jgi:hypothetical protein
VNTNSTRRQGDTTPLDLKMAPIPNMHMPSFYETEIRRLLSAGDWFRYKSYIIAVINGGPKKPSIRQGKEFAGLLLRQLVQRNPNITGLHNDYVEGYNAEQRLKTHHLPTFPEPGAGNGVQEVKVAGGSGGGDPMGIDEEVEDDVDCKTDDNEELTEVDIDHNNEPGGETANLYKDINNAFQIPEPTPYGTFWGVEPLLHSQRHAYLHWLEYRGNPFPTTRPMVSEATLIGRAVGRGSAWVHDEIMRAWACEQHSVRGEWYRENRVEVLGAEPKCTDQTRREWQAWAANGGKRFGVPP